MPDTPLASSYAPHGAPSSYLLGNAVQRSLSYNVRLQMQEAADVDSKNVNGCAGKSASPYLGVGKFLQDLRMYWGSGATSSSTSQSASNNGNLYQEVMDTCNGTNLNTASEFTQTMGYDNVNRLNSFSDSGGAARSYSFDAYGNLAVSSASGMPLNTQTPVITGSQTVGSLYSNNRLKAATYDNAGNQLTALGGCTSKCATYDAENRLTAFQNAGYAYDGDGHRVLKLNGSGGTNTTYVYDALGREVGEYLSVAATRACTTCYVSGIIWAARAC